MVVRSIDGENRGHKRGLYQTFDKNAVRRSCGFPGALSRAWIDVWTWYYNSISDFPQKQSIIACDDGVDGCGRTVCLCGLEITKRFNVMWYPIFYDTLRWVFDEVYRGVLCWAMVVWCFLVCDTLGCGEGHSRLPWLRHSAHSPTLFPVHIWPWKLCAHDSE